MNDELNVLTDSYSAIGNLYTDTTYTSWNGSTINSVIKVNDNTILEFEGKEFSGKDLRELLESKDLIQKLLEKNFPQNYI